MKPVIRVAPRENPGLTDFLKHCHKKTLPARHKVIHADDASDSLYYLIEGSVRVVMESEDANELVLAYLNGGDFFGEMGLFDEHMLRSAGVVTRTQCEIAEIPYSRFMELAKSSPELLFQLSAQLAERLRKTSRKVTNLAFMDVTGRVARTLLDLAEQPDAVEHPNGKQIRVTRQELAKLVGCSREMAGKVLKSMEEDNLIAAKGQTIVVHGTRH